MSGCETRRVGISEELLGNYTSSDGEVYGPDFDEWKTLLF